MRPRINHMTGVSRTDPPRYRCTVYLYECEVYGRSVVWEYAGVKADSIIAEAVRLRKHPLVHDRDVYKPYRHLGEWTH